MSPAITVHIRLIYGLDCTYGVYKRSAKTHVRSYGYGYGRKFPYTDTIIRRIQIRRIFVHTVLANPTHVLYHYPQVAAEALHAERAAVARLQRVCAETASASQQSLQPRDASAPQAPGGLDAQGVDNVLQVS